jgi:predicted nuclease with RNAse H fold
MSAGHLSVAEAIQLVLEDLRPLVVCIDSPAQWSTSGRRREAERALSTIGINSMPTPPENSATKHHDWMRVGFSVYDRLAHLYPRYRGGPVEETAAEYFPHASAVLLAGHIGALKDKVPFRRAALTNQGISLTRLPTVDRVDAALGALTGLIALDGGHVWVGDADEGALLLPVASIPIAPLSRIIETGAVDATAPKLAEGVTSSKRTCGCGCGALVSREFRPGHDAKLRSRLMKEMASSPAARAELERRGWQS